MVDLVMFDIDGTLVDSMEFDGQLYLAAIRAELRIEPDQDWSTYPHVTDSGLLDTILQQHRIDDRDGARRAAVKRLFVAMTRDYIGSDPGAVREIPGAIALLALLRSQPGYRVAIATGGWRETAWLKLQAAGFDLDGIAVASANDAHSRVEIMKIAAQRAMGGLEPRRRTYFGDGVWDLRACADLGWDFIAIGDRLAHEPAFASFSDHARILASLGVRSPPPHATADPTHATR